MAPKINLLCTCVGRRVSVLKAFRLAAKQLGINLRLLGADCSPTAPALHITDKYFIVPSLEDESYMPTLLEICRAEKVDMAIPFTDWELPAMSANRARFKRVGTRVVVSTPNVIEICRDKRNTYQFLKANGFDTPRLYSHNKAVKGPFPFFMKPRYGSAARNIHFVGDRPTLEFYHHRSPEHVIQEFIRGEEFTVDVLADFSGKALCAVPRQRLEVRAGEVSKGLTVKHRDIMAQSMRLVNELKGCRGVITTQCFLTPKNEIKFIEMNPRFGGGIPLAIRAGANFPKWLLQMHLGKKPDIKPDAWRDGLLMLRYDEAIFVDEDKLQK